MKRIAEKYLDEWKIKPIRKPLIIRGARQVGKTYLAETWGEKNFTNVVTVNLERDSHLSMVFRSKNPRAIIDQLSLITNSKIIPSQTLLIIDEIQASEDAISSLRYFYEEMKALHVLATGSLLDFTLRELSTSAPVGRIEYLYLAPLNFSEFVEAVHGQELPEILKTSYDMSEIAPSVHDLLLNLLRTYYFIGGMPEAVASYASSKDLIEVQRVQSSILATFQDDFAKYRTRLNLDAIRNAFQHSSLWPARRTKYSEIKGEFRSSQLKQAFELLKYARVVNCATASAANGVPLAAEQNPKRFKPIFLDIGLCNRACNLILTQNIDELLTIREGALAEQFVGQELLSTCPSYEDPQLFYWESVNPSSSAEIDFLLEVNNRVVPVEVKAARRGALRSLQVFLSRKNLSLALRLSTREKKIESISSENSAATLLSLPLYLAAKSREVCVDWLSAHQNE